MLRWLVAHHAVAPGTAWRTRCDTCAAPLWPAACGPSGRCRTCRARIGAPPYWLEAVAALAIGLLVVVLLAPLGGPASSWWSAAISAAVLAGFYALTRIISRGDLGLGDVAFAVPVGFGAGWYDWRLAVAAVVVGHTLAAAGIVGRRITGRPSSPLPLGTYLVAALLAVVVVHRIT